MTQKVQGIGASSGIAIGKAFVLPTWEWDVPEEKMDPSDLAREFERLYEGIRSSKDEIEFIKSEIREMVGNEESSIFDAHLAILDDPIFMNEIQGIIQRQYKAAEVAVKEAIDHFVTMFDLLDDEYMKERALDIKDVGNRLLKHLLGAPEITLPTDTQPYILVAKELSPSQLVHLNPKNVLGIVMLLGERRPIRRLWPGRSAFRSCSDWRAKLQGRSRPAIWSSWTGSMASSISSRRSRS